MNCSTTHILSILTSVHLDIATIFMTPAKWMHTQTKTHRYELTHPLTHKNIRTGAIHTRTVQPLHAHVCLTLSEEL